MATNPTKFNGGVRVSAGQGEAVCVLDSISSAPSTTTNKLYNLNGTLTFAGSAVGSGSGASGSLDEAYSNGASITVDTGALTLNDATTGAVNTLALVKTGAGSGNMLDLSVDAALTGNAIALDMNLGVAAVGVYIDAGGTARTGADIQVNDDSIGSHSVIDINSSGAGTTVGFDFTGSYTGSPGGQVFLVTLDANDNLDTEIMQVTTGAGERSVMFDLNFGHTDSGTTSHIFDIDVSAILDSNIFDFATGAACTGNVFFVNLDAGLAMTALHVEGSGAREQPMVEISTDATGSANVIELAVSGAISGNLIDVTMSTTSTGDVLAVDMDGSVGGRAIYLDSGDSIRTAALIDILADGSGNADVFNLDLSNTGGANLFDINISGAGTGLMMDIDVSGASSGNLFDATIGSVLYTGDVLSIALGATAVGAQAVVITTGNMTRTTNLIDVTESGTASGNMFDLNVGAALFTGDIFNVNLGATAAGSQVLVVASGDMIRTTALFQITDSGASTGAMFDLNRAAANEGIMFDIDDTAVATGNIFDYATDSASTGTIFEINMTNAVGAILGNYTLAGTRTADAFVITDSSAGAVDVFQITSTSTSSGHIFNVDVDSVFTGNVLDITFGTSAATGDAVSLAMGTNLEGSALAITAAGARTDDLIKIDDSSTSNAHVFDISLSDVYTGSVFNVGIGAAATTGYVLNIDLNLGVAYGAINLDAGGGTKTVDMVDVTFDGDGNVSLFDIDASNTGSGNLFDIDVSDVHTGNEIDITYSAAATGNAIDLNMGSNVAGMAISITSAGTGVSGEGCALDVAHTGALVAGADVIRVASTGNISSTSNLVAIEQSSGAGTAGANCLYIDATGTNVEALEINTGLFFQSIVDNSDGSGNGETLSSSANVSFYDPNGASRTGVILGAGLRHGQQVTVINTANAAEDVTFAAAGTSNVAGGASVVISQFEQTTFTWSATTSLWYAGNLT